MTHRLIRTKNESSWSHFLCLRTIHDHHETQEILHRLPKYDLSCSSPIYRKSQKRGGGIVDHHWGGTRNARVPPRFVRLSPIPRSLGWSGPEGLALRLKVALADHLLLLTFRLIVRLNLKKVITNQNWSLTKNELICCISVYKNISPIYESWSSINSR